MKDLLIEKFYELSKKPYQKYFKKNKPWNINKKNLLQYPETSLGFHLGCFLLKYNFELQEKLEDHDIIHVLTNTGITVAEEIGMQYYLFGNGKRSLYLYMVILTGTIFYPTHFRDFIAQYHRGKKAFKFYYLDYSKMLFIPVEKIKESFKIQ
jgi:ubiquinone biosynthesis protein Coq4